MNSNLAYNVVGFKNDSVSEYVDTYLDDKSEWSENTSISYKKWIEEFFMYQFNSDIVNLTWEQLYSVNYKDALKYVHYLKKTKNLANTTINSKISALKNLWDYLDTNNKNIDLKAFKKIKRLDEEDNSYDSFTDDQIYLLLEFCKEHGRKKRLEKYLYFKTLYTTALRKTALLNLKWNEIKQLKDKNTGKMFWTIKTKDKGNKYDIIAIPDELYEELLGLKGDKDKVFNINENTLYKVLSDFVEMFGLRDFKLSIHSVKSSSIDKAWILTGKDIKATSKHGHHSNINTTSKRYLGKNEDLGNQPSLKFFNKMDMGLLECVSREELVNAIKGCDEGVIRAILGKLEL